MPPDSSRVKQIEGLYREHSATLVLFATAIGGDRSRAQDLVHQVFAKLLEDGLEHAASPKAFVFACVRNAMLNEVKFESRHVQLDDYPWFAEPEQRETEKIMLRRALADLPLEQREVVVLHIWAELTFAEIAGVLRISVNTAASRYRYGLARLRALMESKEKFDVRSR